MGSCDEHAASKLSMSTSGGILDEMSLFLRPRRSFTSSTKLTRPSHWSSMNVLRRLSRCCVRCFSTVAWRQNTTIRSISLSSSTEARCDKISKNLRCTSPFEMRSQSLVTDPYDSACASRRMAMAPASPAMSNSRKMHFLYMVEVWPKVHMVTTKITAWGKRKNTAEAATFKNMAFVLNLLWIAVSIVRKCIPLARRSRAPPPPTRSMGA
mmetsp:Transcript_10861/g.28722  ORF Transcript_10861/g.28722 Transcript_10861/m.28722 type:complete len:210 (-) Transcript_10861:457-1086(-)